MSENIKEDFLEVDPKIPGQNFVCMSFVSPEKVLKKKEIYFVTKFMEYLFQNEDQVSTDLRNKLLNKDTKINYDLINGIYEDWKYSRENDLENEFYELNEYRTSVRGIKIRGVYDTYREAQVRAQVLQRKDPSFHVFVGQVGYWLPWDPNSDIIPEQQYQEQQLNELVKNYKTNLEDKDVFFEEEKRLKIERAKKEAERKRAEYIKEHNVKVLDTNEQNIENIEKLRTIVDEADKNVHEAEEKLRQQLYGQTTKTDLSSLDEDDPWIKNKLTNKVEDDTNKVEDDTNKVEDNIINNDEIKESNDKLNDKNIEEDIVD